MFSFSLAAATLAISALSASAGILPRHHAIAHSIRDITVPSTYDQNVLENYTTYHERYLALGCEYNHGNGFFDLCCHPLLKTQSLSDRDPKCTPDAGVLSSVSASLEGETSSGSAAVAATPVAALVQTTAAVASSSSWSASSDSWTPSSSDSLTPTSTWSSAAAATSSSSGSSGLQYGSGTFFYQNGVAGACGTVHSDYDMVVAIITNIYEEGVCGKSLTITNTANGKSVTATVADECPTCNPNSIDMSIGVFTQIGDESTGLLDISWSFN